MTETHTLNLVVDASGAEAGAKKFDAAIKQIEKNAASLNASATKAVREINATFRSVDVSKAASSTNNLAAIMRNLKAPTAAQNRNFKDFATNLANMKAPANASAIVRDLDLITAAAQRTVAALKALQSVRIQAPTGMAGFLARTRGRQASGGQGGAQQQQRRGNQGYGPRTNTNGRYDGIFSGQTRATGELRGLENVANPTYQFSSIARTAIGTITAGSFIKDIYSANVALTQFQHVLEVTDNSEKGVAERMAFTSNVAQKLKLDINAVREGFGAFSTAARFAGFSNGQAERIFQNFSIGLRAVGADATAQSQTFHALTTIMSNGRIQMAQVHRQMQGLPGAAEAIAKAYYIAIHKLPEAVELSAKQTSEALVEFSTATRKGQVSSAALLGASDLIARMYKTGLPTALKSTQAAATDLGNAWNATLTRMGEKGGVMDAITEQFTRFAAMLSSGEVSSAFDRLAQGIAQGIRMIGDGVAWAVRNMDTLIPIFKTLVVLGVAEAVIRMRGAFAGLAGLVGGLIAPLTRVIGLLASFAAANAAAGITNVMQGTTTAARARVASALSGVAPYTGPALGSLGTQGAVSGLAGVQAATAATTAGFSVVAAAGTAAFIAIAAAVVAAGVVIYEGRDKLVTIGNQSAKVGDVWKELALQTRDSFVSAWTEIGSFVGNALGVLTSQTDTWAASLTRALVGLANGRANRSAEAADQQAHPENYEIDSMGEAFGATYRPKAGYKVPGVMTNEERLTQIEDQRKARITAEQARGLKDNRNSLVAFNGITSTGFATRKATGDGSEQALLPTPADSGLRADQSITLPGTPKAASHKKSPKEVALERFNTLEGTLGGEIGAMEKYEKASETISTALKLQAITSEQASKATAQLNVKTLEGIGIVNPMVKAQRQMNDAVGTLSTLLQKGVITQEEYAKGVKNIASELEHATHPFDFWLKKINQETADLGLSNKARERAIALRELEAKMLKESGGAELTTEQKKQASEAIDKNFKAQDLKATANDGLAGMSENIHSFYEELAKAEGTLAASLKNHFADFLTTGKFNVKSFGDEVLKELNHVVTDQIFKMAMQALSLTGDDGQPTSGNQGFSLLGSMLGLSNPHNAGAGAGGAAGAGAAAGGAGMLGGIVSAFGKTGTFGSEGSLFGSGGFFSSLFGSGGGAAGGLGADAGSAITDLGLYLEGGISSNPVSKGQMSAAAFANAPHFAEGTGNTSGGMPAILHPNEAVIPLSRGRAVPIEMKGARGGGGGTTHVWNITTPDANSFRESQAQIETRYASSMTRSVQKNGA